MGFLTGKKLLVLGFIVVLLAAIPITLFLVRTQSTDPRTRATPATRLYFMHNNSQQFPIQKNVGDTFTLDIMMDPGSNQVIAVALNISYDTTKLSVPQGGGLKEESSAFSSVLEQPVYNNGNITMTMTIGVDVTKAIKTTTKIATLTMKADNPTGSTPTQIKIAPSSQVTSTADPDVNVLLSNPPPASVIIGGSITPTTTITPTPRVGTTVTPAVVTATPPIGGANQAPVCAGLQASTTNGTAPLPVSFTATGTDTGGKLTKATFNFGDGSVQDVTEGTAIGSSSATVQTDHTYTSAGTFSASVLFTDDGNAASSTTTCTQIITVEEGVTPTTEVIPTKGFPEPSEPGPGDTFIGVGVIATILAIIGGIFFFAL